MSSDKQDVFEIIEIQNVLMKFERFLKTLSSKQKDILAQFVIGDIVDKIKTEKKEKTK